MRLLTTLCIALIGISATAQTDITGFRGWEWDTPFADLSDQLVPSKNKTPGLKGYDKKSGENFQWEGVTAHTITYVFKREKLLGVNIGLYKKDLDKVVAALTKKYGEPKITDTPFLKNYEWHLPSTDMALTLLPTNDSDKSLMISIGKKR